MEDIGAQLDWKNKKFFDHFNEELIKICFLQFRSLIDLLFVEIRQFEGILMLGDSWK